jgi:putative oxidoreductase
MIPHGYDKLVHISDYQKTFLNFMGMGSTISLLLTIFAEFFCSVFLVMGLFSRVSALILFITMTVATFLANNGDVFGKAEHAMLYLVGYTVIILIGPGKASMDGILSK